jgi:uroporphyrinogen-III synthase
MSMKIDVSEADLELLVKAVDQYYAYTIAVQRPDERFKVLRDQLRSQGQKHFEVSLTRKSPVSDRKHRSKQRSLRRR